MRNLTLNWEKSKALAEATGARLKECFRNAFLAVYCRSELRAAHYVEGFAVSTFFPVEHGWIEVGGEILDPTWVCLYEAQEMQAFQYFGVYRLSQAEVEEYAHRRKQALLPTYSKNTQAAWKSPEMIAAYAEAYRACAGDQVADFIKAHMEPSR